MEAFIHFLLKIARSSLKLDRRFDVFFSAAEQKQQQKSAA